MAKFKAIAVYEHLQLPDGRWVYRSTGVKANAPLSAAQRKQRTEGRYVLSFYLNGKKQFRPTETKYLREAQAEADNLLKEHIRGQVKPADSKDGTVKAAIEPFLKNHGKGKEEGTVHGYRRILDLCACQCERQANRVCWR